jgi:hypothetical protein
VQRAHLLPVLEIDGRVAADRRPIGKQNYLRGAAAFSQSPGDHESIAAVISLPAQDDDAGRVQVRVVVPEVFGDGGAGIFHQL